VRRLALVVVAGLALAGCGGSNHAATTNSTAAAQAQIKSAYQKFFSSKTNVPGKIALLQNGPRFELLVKNFYYNPLAKNVSVTVSSVTPHGNTAKVVYIVKLAGAGLPKQTGTAVLQNGTWKVGDASLCQLVSLQGTTPSVCKS
jgi:hypothetical protein